MKALFNFLAKAKSKLFKAKCRVCGRKIKGTPDDAPYTNGYSDKPMCEKCAVSEYKNSIGYLIDRSIAENAPPLFAKDVA